MWYIRIVEIWAIMKGLWNICLTTFRVVENVIIHHKKHILQYSPYIFNNLPFRTSNASTEKWRKNSANYGIEVIMWCLFVSEIQSTAHAQLNFSTNHAHCWQILGKLAHFTMEKNKERNFSDLDLQCRDLRSLFFIILSFCKTGLTLMKTKLNRMSSFQTANRYLVYRLMCTISPRRCFIINTKRRLSVVDFWFKKLNVKKI